MTEFLNVTFTFVNFYTSDRGFHIGLRADTSVLGGGVPSDYSILCTFTEIEALPNAPAFRALIKAKLEDKIGITSRHTKLLGFLGSTFSANVDDTLMKRVDSERVERLASR
jgi:hypothetical protein